MRLIDRPKYMDFLIRNKDRQIIKVVSGVRRCGKSTLFKQFRDYLLANQVDSSQIIAINFEDLAFESLLEYHALYQYINERLIPDKKNYIFLDEIQHVAQFEKVVDSIYIKDNVDLYITGSNAFFMSGEIATLLTGRYVELEMLPLSFNEFCEGTDDSSHQSLEVMYNRYIEESSFPYTRTLGGAKFDVQEYLRGLYNTILLKDVVQRLRVTDVAILESIVKYIFANVGSLLSASKIANSLTSAGRKVDSKTVERYLKGLEDSLILYRANRYNVRGKELLKLNPKYYVVDPALRYYVVGNKGYDTGHMLENVIYLELRRRGYTVYIGSIPNSEIDFVAIKDNQVEYYQVSESTLQAETLERELKPLRSLNDHYPKYLLTLDRINGYADYDGIQKINALDWLLNKNK